VTQPDVELWLAHGRTIRQRLRDFLRGAGAQRRCADLAVPWLGRDGLSVQIIADDKRWTLLRRCLPDETMDLRVRAAGRSCCATDKRHTHIVELARDHLITGEAGGFPASENSAELWQADVMSPSTINVRCVTRSRCAADHVRLNDAEIYA
jgi:hypothetical protein